MGELTRRRAFAEEQQPRPWIALTLGRTLENFLSMRLVGRRVGVGGVPLAQAAAMVSLRAAIWLPVGKVPVVARAVAMDSLRAAVWSRAAISLYHSSADAAIPGTSIKS
jgi:hypothetical protein